MLASGTLVSRSTKLADRSVSEKLVQHCNNALAEHDIIRDNTGFWHASIRFRGNSNKFDKDIGSLNQKLCRSLQSLVEICVLKDVKDTAYTWKIVRPKIVSIVTKILQ